MGNKSKRTKPFHVKPTVLGAIEAVRSAQMNLTEAKEAFDIDRKTIQKYRRLQEEEGDAAIPEELRTGTHRIFSKDQEAEVKVELLRLAKMFHGFPRYQAKVAVYEMAVNFHLQDRFPNGAVGEAWAMRFLDDNEDVKEALRKNTWKKDAFLAAFSEIVQQRNIKATNTLLLQTRNYVFQLKPKWDPATRQMPVKAVLEPAKAGKRLTLMFCCDLLGTTVSKAIVFPSEDRPDDAVVEAEDDNLIVLESADGSLDEKVYTDWLEQVLIPASIFLDGEVVFIYEGHAFQKSRNIGRLLDTHSIHPLHLPCATDPMKKVFGKFAKEVVPQDLLPTRNVVPILLLAAFQAAFSAEFLKAEIVKTGLFLDHFEANDDGPAGDEEEEVGVTADEENDEEEEETGGGNGDDTNGGSNAGFGEIDSSENEGDSSIDGGEGNEGPLAADGGGESNFDTGADVRPAEDRGDTGQNFEAPQSDSVATVISLTGSSVSTDSRKSVDSEATVISVIVVPENDDQFRDVENVTVVELIAETGEPNDGTDENESVYDDAEDYLVDMDIPPGESASKSGSSSPFGTLFQFGPMDLDHELDRFEGRSSQRGQVSEILTDEVVVENLIQKRDEKEQQLQEKEKKKADKEREKNQKEAERAQKKVEKEKAMEEKKRKNESREKVATDKRCRKE